LFGHQKLYEGQGGITHGKVMRTHVYEHVYEYAHRCEGAYLLG
jgi:hypothetical protein